jgi:non-ribosomal peptide synthetase-like protein
MNSLKLQVIDNLHNNNRINDSKNENVRSFANIPESLQNELTKNSQRNNLNILSIFSAGIKFLLFKYLTNDKSDFLRIKLHLRNDILIKTAEIDISDIKIESTTTLQQLILQCNSFITNHENINFNDALKSFNGKGCLIFEINLSEDENSIPTNAFIKINLKEDGTFSIGFECPDLNPLAIVFKSGTNHFFNTLKILLFESDCLIRKSSFIDVQELSLIEKYSNGLRDEKLCEPICLHRLFEDTVSKYPFNTALISNHKSYTYEELNNSSNQLARFLINEGVKAGDCVSILFNKSFELYYSMLGILKAGATYVPIDPGYPEDRINFIVKNCEAKFLLSTENFSIKYKNLSCPVLYIEKEVEVFSKYEATNLPDSIVGLTPENIAYAIYTSGSTGTPKGVLIPHKSISNLVRAEGKLFNLTPDDKVFQGFSVAFDASLEEIWLAFHSGAALVMDPDKTVLSAELLCKYLNDWKVTVLSTVPTLLSMMTDEIDSLRILILGGEVCPHELLTRWYRKGRRIVNTYGPTETTVIATYTDFDPEDKITIGKPLTNYTVRILDSDMQIVPIGVAGEIHIGGESLAKGYIKRDELTNTKFIETTSFDGNNRKERIYKTGDLGYFNEKGNIEFAGRIDTQVKLRGFRIELSEIESQILQCEEVKNAVVLLKENNNIQYLVAYLLIENGKKFDQEKIKNKLKTKLASYMIPTSFIKVDAFPLTTSGKIDKNYLAKLKPENQESGSEKEVIEPRTEIESRIHKVWQKYFNLSSISITDDFFELGGHSLLASLVISALRKQEGTESLSVQDIYSFPTIERLASYATQLSAKANSNADERVRDKNKEKINETTKVKPITFYVTSLLQLFSIGFFYSLGALVLISPLELKHLFPLIGFHQIVLVIFIVFLSAVPVAILMSVIVKWTVIGKFKAGTYPLWGFYYFRFWFVKKFIDAVPLTLLVGTPIINYYYRLMGAKIGKNVYMGSDRLRIFDLITIDDNSSISKEACLMGYKVENGNLIIGNISISKNCFVGTRALLNEDTFMEANSSLGELSLLPSGFKIPADENWVGSPAKLVSTETDELKNKYASRNNYPYYLFLQCMAIIIIQLFPLLILVPHLEVFYWIYTHTDLVWSILSIVPVTASSLISFYLTVAFLKWVVLGKSKEEVISIYSLKYIRKWFVDTLMQLTLLYVRPIYATIYVPAWLRLMGAKVGRKAEISTVNQITTDLLEIGSESFLADSVSIGAASVKNGNMYLRSTSIGKKTFIGNSAVLSSGAHIGNNVLIGALSSEPINLDPKQRENSSWLGSPPMFLPKRQISEGFSDELTFNPPLKLIVLRGFIEFFKITLPYIISSVFLGVFFYEVYTLVDSLAFIYVWGIAVVILSATSLSTALLTVFAKLILIGKYKPCQKPLWNTFVWRNELVNSLTESLVYPLFVSSFLGTPFAPWFFRLMGCKIGKKVFMETTEITEFDLVNIGNNVALNFGSTIQTHLFEDRIMKMSILTIEDNCSVGALSVVLYDSKMEKGANLKSLSLLMKGEILPANTQWQGSPAQFYIS